MQNLPPRHDRQNPQTLLKPTTGKRRCNKRVAELQNLATKAVARNETLQREKVQSGPLIYKVCSWLVQRLLLLLTWLWAIGLIANT